MAEYKPNSHKSKEKLEKKIEKPVVSGARIKKKSQIRKLADVFVPEDVQSVKLYILQEVITPAIKKTIFEIVESMLYGETGRSKKSGTASKISYRSFYEKNDHEDRSNSRSSYSYGDIEVDTRKGAEAILSALEDLISQYHYASVADLYDLAELEHKFTDNKYGWTDVQNASIVRTRNGYLLKMPKCMPLD